jgi:hypothetical protein
MHEKKFVLTVPAVWSDKAKDATFRVDLPLPLSLIPPYSQLLHAGCKQSWNQSHYVDKRTRGSRALYFSLSKEQRISGINLPVYI